MTDWQQVTADYLRDAIDDVEAGNDPTTAIDAAMTSARVWMEQIPDPGDLAPTEPACICPPGLLARSGFRGGCPVHSSTARL